MNEINKQTIKDPNDFIDWWNRAIRMSGYITVLELKKILGLESVYTDNKYGWTKDINVDNFIVCKKRFEFIFQLNLPEYEKLESV